MTFQNGPQVPITPAILPAEVQQAVWFLGALVQVRAGGDATGGQLAILEHHCERGFSSPLHRHDEADETFFVLDGELRVEVDGQAQAAGAGAVAFLPRKLAHTFVVTSAEARYLTLHTPAGFDRFALAAGTPATAGAPRPDDLPPDPDPATLARIAAEYGIEILGPPISP